MQTVVAGAAVLDLIVLAEVVEQQLSAARIRLGICHGFHQQLLSDFLLGDRLALHELLQFLDVLVAVECDALAFLSVSASTSCLLIISFDALRYVVMYHEAHVRLVDAHAECNCCHDHIYFFHQELVLVLSSCLGIESRVIWGGFYSIDVQQFCEFLHLLSAQAVDDAGLACILLYIFYDVSLRIGFVPYFIIEIRPVE